MGNCENRYRSVFISDVHLGAVGSRPEQVEAFLASFECDYLYLVGDIVDGWVGTTKGKWTQAHTNVIRALLNKSRCGTTVYYTPGNHDAFMRRFNGSEFGSVWIDHSFEHITADGRSLLVVHGDLFDKTVTRYKPLAWTAAWGYEFLTVLNAKVNSRRTKRNRSPIDIASAVKLFVKRLVKRGTSFESQLIEEATVNGFDGVVCGHIHRPMIETINGVLYINTGDWVEHGTAVVESATGELSLVHWPATDPTVSSETIRRKGRQTS